ncbi:MAG: hypothetical protein MJ233_02935 [Mycoplasmoidaceae bacterium]|nr:hypothetical protein [Mycoplasmoidaceae bacterium]
MKNITKILTGLSILTVTPMFSMVACTPEKEVAFDVAEKTVDQAKDNSVTFVVVAKEKIECEIIEPMLFCGEQKIAGEVTTKEQQKWTIKFAFDEKIEESSECEIQFSFKGKRGIETTKISGLTINPYNPLHVTWNFKEHDYVSKVAQSTITTMSDAEATDNYFKQLKEEPYTYIDDMFMSVAEVISFPGADVTVNEFTYEINVSNINFDQKTISFYQNMQLDTHIKYGEEFEGDIITKG